VATLTSVSSGRSAIVLLLLLSEDFVCFKEWKSRDEPIFAVDLHLRRCSQFNESRDLESLKVYLPGEGLRLRSTFWGSKEAGGLCGRSGARNLELENQHQHPSISLTNHESSNLYSGLSRRIEVEK
jgi:hypothetical protein